MPRKKPRFTVDPPPFNPDIGVFANWAYTQLQRVEDWWPKDYGDRVTALEELQTGIKGEWSISGESSIRFEGVIEEEAVLSADDFLYLLAEPNPNSSFTIEGESIDTDLSDNFAVLTTSSAKYGDDQALVLKFDIDGNVLWQKYLYNSAADLGSAQGLRGGVRFNSSGDVIAALPVLYDAGNLPQNRGLVTKLNGSDGSILWQIMFYESADTASLTELSCLEIDSEDNIYIAGRFEGRSTTYRDAMVIKLDSAGAIQWQVGYWGSATWDYNVNEISVVGSNMYLAVDPQTIIKASTNDGSVAWSRRLDIYSDDFIGIDADSSGNVYVFARSLTGGSSYYGTVTKYDSTGNRQWTRKVSSAAVDYYCYSGRLDANEKAYIIGRISNGAVFDSVVTTLDSSGNIESDRYLRSTSTGDSIFLTESKLTTGGSLLTTGFYTDGTDKQLLVAKLPNALPVTRTVGALEHGDSSITGSDQTPAIESALSITTRTGDSADTLTSEFAVVDGAFIEDLTYWERTA